MKWLTKKIDVRAIYLSAAILICFSAPFVQANEKPFCYTDRYEKVKTLLDGFSGHPQEISMISDGIDKLLQELPNCAPVYRQYARFIMKTGSMSGRGISAVAMRSAKMQLEKALSIDPNFADAYVLLSSVYIKMGDYKQAKIAANNALKRGSKSPWLYMRFATIALHENNFTEAEKYYRKILDSSDLSDKETQRVTPVVIDRLQKIYIQENKLDQAGALFRLEITRSKNRKSKRDEALSHGNYASFLLYHAGDYNQAITEAKTALSLMNFGMARFVLASSYYRKWAESVKQGKDKKEAQIYFDQAYALFPDLLRVKNEADKFEETKIISSTLDKYSEVAIATHSRTQ